MLGASYGQGTVDVWDTSSADGRFYLLDQITLEGPVGPVVTRGQGQHRAHSTALEPSGRFFVVNDLGGDSLHILSAEDRKVHFQSRVQVQPVGCGPRHGAFLSLGHSSSSSRSSRKQVHEEDAPLAGMATHYVVACELSSQLLLFEVSTYTAVIGGRAELAMNQGGGIFRVESGVLSTRCTSCINVAETPSKPCRWLLAPFCPCSHLHLANIK